MLEEDHLTVVLRADLFETGKPGGEAQEAASWNCQASLRVVSEVTLLRFGSA